MYNSLPRPLSRHEDGGDEPHGTENMPGFYVKENREHVRASISAVVRFSVMSPAEYNSTKASKERNSPGMPRTNDKPFSSLTEASFCKTCEPYLSGLLLRIDEKLDRILDIVSEGEDREEKTEKGKALDISGTGMTLLSEKEYQVGDILKTDKEDIGASPYAILSYEVDRELGGKQALAVFRAGLHAFDIRLILDFVPNHMAVDTPLLSTNPDLFLHDALFYADSDDYFKHKVRGKTYTFAHGRDPYFPGWTDTVQVDYSKEATRVFMADLMAAAPRCPMIIIFDSFIDFQKIPHLFDTFHKVIIPRKVINCDFLGEQ